jgi:DDE family transposase
MSDNLRRYRAICDSIVQWFPGDMSGRQRRQLLTLAALISGIVGSRHSHLDKIAAKVPLSAKPDSRTKRFGRWTATDAITPSVFFLPVAASLLAALAHRPLILLLDGSTVGRGCIALLVSVAYRGRALPLAWVVVRGSKGHLSDDVHLQLLHQLFPLVPRAAQVVLLGDGEFDSLLFQQTVRAAGWIYVCRTACHLPIQIDGEWLTIGDLARSPGVCLLVPDVRFTTQAYGPINLIAWWEHGYAKPLFLVTNAELCEEACAWYRRRFGIETLFGDQKSRGFQLHKSHLSDPLRLARLLIAVALAYLWIVYLGTVAHLEGWDHVIHRTDRCDLSLFQLGLRLLEHFLNEAMPLPVAFLMLDIEFD